MNIPKTEEGKIILILVNLKTGNILNKNGDLYLNSGNEYYSIFNNIEEAVCFANNKLESDVGKYEILLYNHNSDFIKVIR